jgi:DNA-binding CsgD family transcriptional regulator
VSDLAPAPLHARFAETDRSAFVGRHTEIASIEDAWALVESGERQAIFISGEPGVGKSRLAAETARALHRNGVTVLLGTNSPDLSSPYQPLTDILEQILEVEDGTSVAELLPGDPSQLLRMTSTVLRFAPKLTLPPETDQEYRLELFSSYTETITRLCQRGPVAMVLEDLHWSTPETRLMLSHLIRNTDGLPLLVMGTMRNNTPDRSEDLAVAVADLYRLPGIRRIDLTGLDSEAIQEYLSAEAGSDLPYIRETAAILRDRTGGNPFFVTELWREVADTGGYQALRSKTRPAPQSVRDTIGQRLTRLDESTLAVLEVAAVLGDMFDARDIATAQNMESAAVLNALDAAKANGLISTTDHAGSFAFTHALVRQTLIDRLATLRSAQIHKELALSLRDQTAPAAAPQLLARLFEGASALGFDDEASRYLELAAREAGRGLAHEEHAALLERAANVRGVDPDRRTALLLEAGVARRRSGDFSEARRLYATLFKETDPHTALVAAIGYEDASWRPGLHGELATQMLESALDNYPQDPKDATYVAGMAALGGPVVSEALELARGLGDQQIVADALISNLLRMMTVPAKTAIHYQHASELREIVLNISDYDKLGPAGAYRANAAYMGGEWDDWAAGVSDIRLAADRTGQPFWDWVVGCFDFSTLLTNGDLASARHKANEIRLIGASFGADDTDGPYGIQMYMVNREAGNLEAARPIIEAGLGGSAMWTPGVLAICTDLGMDDMAHDLLHEMLSETPVAYSGTAIWPAVLVYLAEAAVKYGNADSLEKVLPMLREYDGYNLIVGQSVTVMGSSNRYLAQVCAALGDAEGARKHFETALSMDSTMRSPLHEADTAALFSVWLREQGDRDDAKQARQLESRARAIAEPKGLTRILAIVDSQSGAADLPDGLTPREIDVLRFLADGASNKQIGEALFISQNTAANHVRSILMKTDTTNRTQAAMYAAQNGLLER